MRACVCACICAGINAFVLHFHADMHVQCTLYIAHASVHVPVGVSVCACKRAAIDICTGSAKKSELAVFCIVSKVPGQP